MEPPRSPQSARQKASSGSASPGLRGLSTPKRPSNLPSKSPSTATKPKVPALRAALRPPLSPQPRRSTLSSSSSSAPDTPIGEPRLYSGSICYITEDLLKRVSKTKTLSEVKQLKLFFPDSKVVFLENLESLRNLEELDLTDNRVERVRNLEPLRHLRVLNLSSNLVSSIEGVELLTRLQELDLSGNLLERLTPVFKHLGALRTLNLTNNKLSTLRDIVHLKPLKNLTQLYMTPNPIMELEHARQFVVFHLSCLNELDGELITDEERAEARERFSADELQHLEFELHSAQLESKRLNDQISQQQQRMEKLEQTIQDAKRDNAALRSEIEASKQELASTCSLLDKKTAEVATLSELLYELKQEIAFQNIDSQFGSSHAPAPRQHQVLESPYLGMGGSASMGPRASSRRPTITPEDVMANLLEQLDAVAKEEEEIAAAEEQHRLEKGKEQEKDTSAEEPTNLSVLLQPDAEEPSGQADDDNLDTSSFIDENVPKDVQSELENVIKRLEEEQTRFYHSLAASASGTDLAGSVSSSSSDTASSAALIEELRAQRLLLEAEQRRYEEWRASEDARQRTELERQIAEMKASLLAKEEQLMQNKIQAGIIQPATPNKDHSKQLSLDQLLKKDLPPTGFSEDPRMAEFLALVEQDHISRIIALLGEVHPEHASQNEASHQQPHSLEEAIQLLRKHLLSQQQGASSTAEAAREQGQPNSPLEVDFTISGTLRDDPLTHLPPAVRERLGQLEAQVSMLEDAKLETFFSEDEDWEQIAIAMRALQQQNRLLGHDAHEQPEDLDEDPQAVEEAHLLRSETARLQKTLAAKMASIKQLWLDGKLRSDPDMEKSAAWRYWTQMSQYQFFYFHLKMQLAHMNHMLQLRKSQLLDVQNRLIDAQFNQRPDGHVITSASLVPLYRASEVIAEVSQPTSVKTAPDISSLPQAPASQQLDAALRMPTIEIKHVDDDDDELLQSSAPKLVAVLESKHIIKEKTSGPTTRVEYTTTSSVEDVAIGTTDFESPIAVVEEIPATVEGAAKEVPPNPVTPSVAEVLEPAVVSKAPESAVVATTKTSESEPATPTTIEMVSEPAVAESSHEDAVASTSPEPIPTETALGLSAAERTPESAVAESKDPVVALTPLEPLVATKLGGTERSLQSSIPATVEIAPEPAASVHSTLETPQEPTVGGKTPETAASTKTSEPSAPAVDIVAAPAVADKTPTPTTPIVDASPSASAEMNSSSATAAVLEAAASPTPAPSTEKEVATPVSVALTRSPFVSRTSPAVQKVVAPVAVSSPAPSQPSSGTQTASVAPATPEVKRSPFLSARNSPAPVGAPSPQPSQAGPAAAPTPASQPQPTSERKESSTTTQHIAPPPAEPVAQAKVAAPVTQTKPDLPAPSTVSTPKIVPSGPSTEVKQSVVQNLSNKLEQVAQKPTLIAPVTPPVSASTPAKADATPSPATSAQASNQGTPSLVKKSPFLLADQKHRQEQTSTPSASPAPRPVLFRSYSVNTSAANTASSSSSASSSAAPSPMSTPTKTHRRAPSETLATPTQMIQKPPTPQLLDTVVGTTPNTSVTSSGSTPEMSPQQKRSLSRTTSGIKPASAQVPGMFALDPPSPRRSLSPSPVGDGTITPTSTGSAQSSSTEDEFSQEVTRRLLPRTGSGIIDTAKVDHNLKPVGDARPTDQLFRTISKRESQQKMRAFLSRSNSVMSTEDEPAK